MTNERLNPYARPGWDGTEAPIFPGSALIGMSVAELEERFGVYCDHVHNSPILRETRSVPPADLKLQVGMTIAIFGELAKLDVVVNLAVPHEAACVAT